MEFNGYIWDLYKKTDEGKKSLDFFSKLDERIIKNESELKEFINNWAAVDTLGQYSDFAENFLNNLKTTDKSVKKVILEEYEDDTLSSLEEAESLFRMLAGDPEEYGDQVSDEEQNDMYRGMLSFIPDMSISLSCKYPKYFFPYFFYPNFYLLQRIFETFRIYFPPIPKKSNYKARFYYYLELNRSLHEYWSKLGLRTEEIASFLYGFAPNIIKQDDEAFDPKVQPKRAWFVGGGINNNGDFDYLDKVTDSSFSFWQGNKDTEVGDIVVMYCLSPRSYIHSIWRANKPGAIEPFRYFYGTISISNPTIVKPLSLAKIKKDKILSKMPLVKGNMQGINGRRIDKVYYDRIIDLLKIEGQNINILPDLPQEVESSFQVKNEKDVENQVLEPLLEALGFAASSWERQVTIKVGRSEKAIPDYLVGVTRKNNSVNADWVWEAKHSIANHSQLEKDFGQVVSYGRLTNAKGVSLVSKEGVWICSSEKSGSVKNADFFPSSEVFKQKNLDLIKKLIL